ncbi:Toll/interleukin-1 receptor homology (TIR) domain [Arabidopsis suecica]|nr:Toll/interleukin-1 receptor homology (TIR) domain [Arabidopsis suecica]
MDDLGIPMNEQEDLSTCDVLDPNTLFSDNNNPNVQPQSNDEFTAGLSHVNLSDYKSKKSQLTRSTIPSKKEVKEDLVKTRKKGNFNTEEAVKRNYKNLINTIFIFLALTIYSKLVCSDMATRFSFRYGRRSTNYSSSSPRFDDDSCPSFSEGKKNSNLVPSPVSYPMRIAVSPGKVHQVFLNFRGEQLRYNFVSHLSDAFELQEIKYFIDKHEQRGKDLKHLFVRIKESSIALAIFSTRYPESSWCMDELVMMKKLSDQGKLLVIPIFYKVDAKDVKKPTGDSEFGKNFWRLAEDSTGDQIKKWKEALESISCKMGLSLGEKSSESDFVKEIVKEVQRVIEAFVSRKKRVIFGRKVGDFQLPIW